MGVIILLIIFSPFLVVIRGATRGNGLVGEDVTEKTSIEEEGVKNKVANAADEVKKNIFKNGYFLELCR